MENYFLFLFMIVFKMIANKFQVLFEPKSRFDPYFLYYTQNQSLTD